MYSECVLRSNPFLWSVEILSSTPTRDESHVADSSPIAHLSFRTDQWFLVLLRN